MPTRFGQSALASAQFLAECCYKRKANKEWPAAIITI